MIATIAINNIIIATTTTNQHQPSYDSDPSINAHPSFQLLQTQHQRKVAQPQLHHITRPYTQLDRRPHRRRRDQTPDVLEHEPDAERPGLGVVAEEGGVEEGAEAAGCSGQRGGRGCGGCSASDVNVDEGSMDEKGLGRGR